VPVQQGEEGGGEEGAGEVPRTPVRRQVALESPPQTPVSRRGRADRSPSPPSRSRPTTAASGEYTPYDQVGVGVEGSFVLGRLNLHSR
jgi:hypothetical protein